MFRIFLCLLALAGLAAMLACNSPAAAGSPNDSPTDAYKRLFSAVKSKNTDAIKAELTQKSQDFAQMVSQKNGTPIEKVFENGFTATTFATSLPLIRDQRVAEDMGAVEVWNSKDSKWEDLPFVKENGAWKLAVGELFAGTYKSPGPGRDQLDKIAANANGSGPQQIPVPEINANAPNVTKENANLNPANLKNLQPLSNMPSQKPKTP